MKKFYAYTLAILFAIAGYIGQDIYTWVKYKIYPAQDQMTQIQQSIEELTQSIENNRQLVSRNK